MSYQPPQFPHQPSQQPPYVPGPPPSQYRPGLQHVPGTPDGAQPPFPPIQPPTRRKKWPWIVGGIVLSMIVGCVGLFTLFLGGTAKVASDLDNNQKGNNAVAGQMGKAANDGKFRFTVTGMHCGVAQVGNSLLGKKAQGEYCLVNVTVKNVGSSAQTFNSSEQSAVGEDGTKLSTDVVAETYVNDQDQTFLEGINPGNQVKGTLVFDVPKGSRPASVVLHESAFTPGVKVPVREG